MIKEELILLYLSNQASSEESKLVQDWAAQNPVEYELMKDIWHHADESKEIKLFDVDAEWDSFLDNLSVESNESNQNKEEAKVIPISRWKEWRPMIAAASMLLLALVAYFLYPKNDIITRMAEAGQNEFHLPDSTYVTLVDDATVSYPRTFDDKDERRVALKGVAVFDIVADPEKPFIVETNGTGVQALGTIFEVDAIDSVKTGVKNIEGLIKFFELANEDNFVEVKEGESFVYDGKGFANTTPVVPKVLTFTPPEPEVPLHTVRDIVGYMYIISNGHTVDVGDDFDWNKEIRIHLETENLEQLIREIRTKASLTLVKKDCGDCYEIRRFRVK